MRTIKYRCWDGNQMVYTDAGQYHVCVWGGPGRIPWGVFSDVDDSRLMTGDPNAIFNPTAILMQFTGLLDKNGKEIYESDILRMDGKYTYEVRFEDAKFVGYHLNTHAVKGTKWGDLRRFFDPDFAEYHVEVIGNIHTNPELIK